MVKTYNITKTVYKVSQLISLLRLGELDLNPNFQRRAVWSKGAKSFLIDTIIRGLPIPVLLFREKRTDIGSLKSVMEIIDGQQRIRAVISYVSPGLLPNYNLAKDAFRILPSHNDELKNKDFESLGSEIRQRILDYQFNVNIFSSEVSDQEIYEMFSRLNSTGYSLNYQELRNSKYFGALKTLVYRLGAQQLERWRDWHVFSEDDISRMKETELVSEFVLMMFSGITTKKQRDLDNMYEDKDEEFAEAKEVEKRFEVVMDTIDEYFGKEIGNTPLSRRTFFYVLYAYIYDLRFGLKSALKRKNPEQISSKVVREIKERAEKVKEAKAPQEVVEIAGRRTTDIATRKRLLSYLMTGK